MLKDSFSIVSGPEFFSQSYMIWLPGRGSKHCVSHQTPDSWSRSDWEPHICMWSECRAWHHIFDKNLTNKHWKLPGPLYPKKCLYFCRGKEERKCSWIQGSKNEWHQKHIPERRSLGDQLVLCYLKCSPCTNSMGVSWEVVRNAESQFPSQTY